MNCTHDSKSLNCIDCEFDKVIDTLNQRHKDAKDFEQMYLSEHKEKNSLKSELQALKKIRPEVLWFAEQMELALRENDHKGGWELEHQSWLLGELFRNSGKIFDSGYSLRRLVNTANFAMMIADNARIGLAQSALKATEQPSEAAAEE